jgi:hypothetical protein
MKKSTIKKLIQIVGGTFTCIAFLVGLIFLVNFVSHLLLPYEHQIYVGVCVIILIAVLAIPFRVVYEFFVVR